MRIGIDIRSLQEGDRFRGIGAYVSNLLRAISRIDAENEYFLYAWGDRDPLQALDLTSHARFHLISLGRRPTHVTAGRLKNCILREVRVSRREIDIFLQPNAVYGLPWGNVPEVAVAYDLIPLIFRDRYWTIPSLRLAGEMGLRPLLRQIPQRWIYRWSIKQLLSAGCIIAISEATKQDLIRYFPHVRGRVTVTHLSCDPAFRPAADTQRVRAKFGIDRPFLLYVGGVDFRKNIAALLESFDRLREQGHNLQLVLVGKEFEFPENDHHPDLGALRTRIAKSRFKNAIRPLGFVEQADLVGLYSAASAFVFPSLYEGFGLPILEAMACGCPVIAYRTSSMPEVAGSAAVLLEPSQDLAEAVAKLLHDEQARTAKTAAGFAQVAKFSWERTAAETLQVLRDMAASGSPTHGI